MKFTPTNIKFIAAALVVIVGVGWYFISRSQKEDATLSLDASFTQPLETRFRQLTGELKIRYDTTVFGNPRFNALVDITVPVSEEPVGHTDPFVLAPATAPAKTPAPAPAPAANTDAL